MECSQCGFDGVEVEVVDEGGDRGDMDVRAKLLSRNYVAEEGHMETERVV